MALTPTTQIELGFRAPAFELPNVVKGSLQSLEELKGEKGTLVMFICNHCPFVIHVLDELVRLGQDYKESGIEIIAISSNNIVTHPQDSPDKMKELAVENGFEFPYLYDESQAIAKAYDAACTPDFSIFDASLSCVYRGQLDDSRPGNDIPLSGKDIREVLECLLNNEPITIDQKPSVGCNIKWKT